MYFWDRGEINPQAKFVPDFEIESFNNFWIDQAPKRWDSQILQIMILFQKKTRRMVKSEVFSYNDTYEIAQRNNVVIFLF